MAGMRFGLEMLRSGSLGPFNDHDQGKQYLPITIPISQYPSCIINVVENARQYVWLNAFISSTNGELGVFSKQIDVYHLCPQSEHARAWGKPSVSHSFPTRPTAVPLQQFSPKLVTSIAADVSSKLKLSPSQLFPSVSHCGCKPQRKTNASTANYAIWRQFWSYMRTPPHNTAYVHPNTVLAWMLPYVKFKCRNSLWKPRPRCCQMTKTTT